MVAPVFIGIAALVTASCLMSVPRAAIGGMAAAVAPIVMKMLFYPNAGVQAMASMMVLITLMQASLVLGRFRETVRMLTLQHELNRLAQSDALTGLDNRLAFTRVFEENLAAQTPVLVALGDLNGFKAANDTHGHLAGDQILIDVAARMRNVAASALSIARLGGDEFALLFDVTHGEEQARNEVDAVRMMIALPFASGDGLISISTSIGMATGPDEGSEVPDLLRLADQRLYAEKHARAGDRILQMAS
jgi:diguanylate cyclase